MRFLLRTLSVICLAITVIFIVVDATRTIGAGALEWTPAGQIWDALAPGGRDAAGVWLSRQVHPFLNDPVLATVTGWPTFALFAFLSFLFYLISRPRRRRLARFGD